MATRIQFWAADGPKGEALIREHNCKVLDAIAHAAMSRPERCVLVTLEDTRPHDRGGRMVELWIKPGYRSETVSGQGLLNTWKNHI